MFCSHCGSRVGEGRFCANCGRPVGQPAPAARPEDTAELPVQGPGHPPRRTGVVIGLLGAAIGIVALLVAALLVLTQDDEPAGTFTGNQAPAAPATGSATATSAGTASPSEPGGQKAHAGKKSRPRADAGPGDVRDLPAGLFCRDLNARGYSYVAAVDYWRAHGQPNQMDIDRNGLPCETVYPASDVEAYWGEQPEPPAGDELPAGLFCRDLYAQGASYAEAVDYWFAHGAPDRMDADLNGLPCETVYPASDVEAYWGP